MTELPPNAIAALTAGSGRGFTVLCLIPEAGLLRALAATAGPTGLVLAAAPAPPAGEGWSAVRCDPAEAIPVRAHVIDAAVLAQTPDLPAVAEEVRRVLVPAGDVRLIVAGPEQPDAALTGAGIRPLRRDPSGVLVCRGP